MPAIQATIQTYPIYDSYDGGFANSQGIVFSSVNGPDSQSISNPISQSIENPISHPMQNPISHPMQNPISHPMQNPISHPMQNPISQQIPNPISRPISISALADLPGQSSNVNQYLDYVSNQSPFNIAPPQNQQVLQNSETHQKPEKPQSTFSSNGFTFAPLLSATSLPMPQQTTSSMPNQVNQVQADMKPKPSKPASTSQSNPSPFSKKCGITNYTHSRVVGGTITQVGQYPWIAALGYRFPNITKGGLQFYCAGSLVRFLFYSRNTPAHYLLTYFIKISSIKLSDVFFR